MSKIFEWIFYQTTYTNGQAHETQIAKKTGNSSKLQSPDKWINKMWYSHTTENHLNHSGLKEV